ncbi:hypothetical protein NC652_031978 [Populus alba x Populus x berolinensis]|nr:hypothetical protein NC652_031978 [Populus alba x Populus x berolinensis]
MVTFHISINSFEGIDGFHTLRVISKGYNGCPQWREYSVQLFRIINVLQVMTTTLTPQNQIAGDSTLDNLLECCKDVLRGQQGSAGLKNGPGRGKKLRSNSVGARRRRRAFRYKKRRSNVNEVGGMINTQKPKGRNRTNNGGTLDEGHDKKDQPTGYEKAKFEVKDRCAGKPRKKGAERLFRKREKLQYSSH